MSAAADLINDKCIISESKLIFVHRTETTDEIIDLSIDNGKKSKRLLTVIENFNSVISDGWVNGKSLCISARDIYYLISGQGLPT